MPKFHLTNAPTKLNSCDERVGTQLGATCFVFFSMTNFAPVGSTIIICLTRIIAGTKKHFTLINLFFQKHALAHASLSRSGEVYNLHSKSRRGAVLDLEKTQNTNHHLVVERQGCTRLSTLIHLMVSKHKREQVPDCYGTVASYGNLNLVGYQAPGRQPEVQYCIPQQAHGIHFEITCQGTFFLQM
jgi:hypothetical protein